MLATAAPATDALPHNDDAGNYNNTIVEMIQQKGWDCKGKLALGGTGVVGYLKAQHSPLERLRHDSGQKSTTS
jgi:hypothetical protein